MEPIRNDLSQASKLLGFASCCLVIVALLYATLGYHAIFTPVNNLGLLFNETFWQILTYVGEANAALALCLFIAFKRNDVAVIVFLGSLLATILSKSLKKGFAMKRPPSELEPSEFIHFGELVYNYSYPSGHTMTVFLLAAVFALTINKNWFTVGALFVALLVGISRVVVGAHWPLDVLTGAAIGIVIAVVMFALVNRYNKIVNKGLAIFSKGLMVIAALSLYTHTGGYDKAQPFAFILATAALVFVAQHLWKQFTLRSA